MESNLSTIRSILRLSDEEIKEISNNPDKYAPLLRELQDKYASFKSILHDKLQLTSKYASYNYSIYELFMKAHDNAIIISGLKAEATMFGLDLGKNAMEKMERLLSKYLLIDPTYGVRDRS
ncbi:MAG: hypothetical protein M1533_02840 [Candidatus Thermoplasmatota archaeon]|jgi:hypothetical protein|nr:hypothetical protein [Candidatus Thermoplasmatota archaeon]MCL5793215.1 hypothetical protein [Candidatus Thermoplasmatota archaeon]